jgi:hypothetical protein
MDLNFHKVFKFPLNSIHRFLQTIEKPLILQEDNNFPFPFFNFNRYPLSIV